MRGDLLLATEALLALLRARLAVLLLPSHRLLAAARAPQPVGAALSLPSEESISFPEKTNPEKAARDLRGVRVARAVMRMSSRLPWQSSCLVQALAGRILLRRRRMAGRILIGVAGTQTALHAHAWLLGPDGETLLGGGETPGMQLLAELVDPPAAAGRLAP